MTLSHSPRPSAAHRGVGDRAGKLHPVRGGSRGEGSLSRTFGSEEWALILGGSSGFGLATAQKLAAHGMSLALVHRDRRGAMHRIEPEFEKLRGAGVALRTWNADALDPAKREEIVGELKQALGPNGRVKLLLHSIAFGNLKLLV